MPGVNPWDSEPSEECGARLCTPWVKQPAARGSCAAEILLHRVDGSNMFWPVSTPYTNDIQYNNYIATVSSCKLQCVNYRFWHQNKFPFLLFWTHPTITIPPKTNSIYRTTPQILPRFKFQQNKRPPHSHLQNWYASSFFWSTPNEKSRFQSLFLLLKFLCSLVNPSYPHYIILYISPKYILSSCFEPPWGPF